MTKSVLLKDIESVKDKHMVIPDPRGSMATLGVRSLSLMSSLCQAAA